jgi:hypothetical protein
VIFDTWLDMPTWGIFGSLIGLFAGSAILIHWLCFGEATRARSTAFSGVVAPFFGSVAVLFALLTGFLANEVWDRNRQANRVILAERDGLMAIHAITIATVSDMTGIRTAAQRYASALIHREWPHMAHQEHSPEAGQELLDLLSLVSDPQVGVEAGIPAQSALLDTVLKLRSARYDRLALSGDQTDRTKWTAVLILGLMTLVAIAIVHLDKPRAQLAALTIFSVAAVVALGLVAIRERPFDGPLHVSPAPLEEAMQVLAKGTTS